MSPLPQPPNLTAALLHQRPPEDPMRIPRAPHAWALSPREAVVVQRKLAARVRSLSSRPTPRYIAGLDVAFSAQGERAIGGVVLWDRHTRTVVEQHTATRRGVFPYVPGLLSFREAPVLLAALRKLARDPDALLCDGHGLAHPRRFGIACHLGVLTDLPAVGCAKSRLVGDCEAVGEDRRARSPLQHHGEVIGSVLRTRTGVNPVFVSVGHRIDLAAAEQLVLDCTEGYRLPEPTRLADKLVAQVKRQRR
jgi:deoxyribonuclease V